MVETKASIRDFGWSATGRGSRPREAMTLNSNCAICLLSRPSPAALGLVAVSG
jgi:hypothetical protein